jgi:hypothetical protein
MLDPAAPTPPLHRHIVSTVVALLFHRTRVPRITLLVLILLSTGQVGLIARYAYMTQRLLRQTETAQKTAEDWELFAKLTAEACAKRERPTSITFAPGFAP